MKTTLLIALSLLLTISCKKNDDSNPAPNNPSGNNCKLATVTLGDTNVNKYEYQADGKIAKITQTINNVITNTQTFTYTPQNMIEIQIFAASGDTTKIIYTLNSSGQITSSTQSTISTPNTITYDYNQDGYLTKETIIFSNRTTTEIHTYTDGNRTHTTTTSSSDTTKQEKSIEYYSEYQDNFLTGYFYPIYIEKIGKGNKNLPKKETSTRGNIIHTNTYTYNMKPNGYPDKMTLTSQNNPYPASILNYTLTYNCP